MIARSPRTFALRTLLLAVLVCAIALTAYRNRARHPDMALVHTGMTYDEVLDAIGEPGRVDEDADGRVSWTYFIATGQRHEHFNLLVTFTNGAVVSCWEYST